MGQNPKSKLGSEKHMSRYIVVMGLLNAMLELVSQSLPQIQETTGMLPEDTAALHTDSGQSSVPR